MKYNNLKNREASFDIFRGFVLIFMGFINAYYATSASQTWLLSHDGPLMSPGDLIMVFFFFMIGFNLELVRQRRNFSTPELIVYSLKRGFLLIAIGSLLISYLPVLFGYNISVLFRSFLVVLGVAMIFTSLIMAATRHSHFVLGIIAGTSTIALFLSVYYPRINLPGNLRFVSPWLLTTSIWGIIIAKWYFNPSGSSRFTRRITDFIGICLVGAIVHFLLFHQVPSRQTMDAVYLLLSWGILWALILVCLKIFKNSHVNNRFINFIAMEGAHPLSYWIIQSLVIALVVMVTTAVYYSEQNIPEYFFKNPVRPRSVQTHWLAILISLLATIICSTVHFVFIQLYWGKRNK